MAQVDPNEVFAWTRAVQSMDLLRQLQQTVSARIDELAAGSQARMGDSGQHLRQPHVQPTDEYSAGPLAKPLTGPSPVSPRGGTANVFEQAAINQRSEREQMASGGEGVGPDPVAVSGAGGQDPDETADAAAVEQRIAAASGEMPTARQTMPHGQSHGQQHTSKPTKPNQPTKSR